MGKKKKITKHHNRNRVNGGTKELSNIILLIQEKHDCWHTLFKNKTFAEAGRLLLRADAMKRKQGKNWKKNFETNYG